MAINSKDNDSSETRNKTESHPTGTCASVDAGICGFTCCIRAWKINQKAVGLKVSESECQQIQNFSNLVDKLTLKELIAPVTRNPVYLAAEQTGCHPSCPVPVAVLKAAEVAMGMALARDAAIRFEPCSKKDPNSNLTNLL